MSLSLIQVDHRARDADRLSPLRRRKLAEARRRDAERYGDVYVEVTDDDVR
jgi:hypothetical protein